MVRVYAIASAKGGVGKTTTTANLGATLAGTGARVVAIDGDVGMANLGAALGISPDGPTLHDALAGEAEPRAAAYEASDGFVVVPGDTSLEAFAAAEPRRLESVVEAFSDADYVLIDVGAGVSHETSVPLSLADEVLLVSTAERDALIDTDKTRQLTERLGGTVAGAVVTRVDPDAPLPDFVATHLRADVLASIPEDEAVRESITVGEPLASHAPRSDAAAAYRRLAAALTGVEPPETAAPDATSESAAEPTADSETGETEPSTAEPTDGDPLADAEAPDSVGESSAASDGAIDECGAVPDDESGPATEDDEGRVDPADGSEDSAIDPLADTESEETADETAEEADETADDAKESVAGETDDEEPIGEADDEELTGELDGETDVDEAIDEGGASEAPQSGREPEAEPLVLEAEPTSKSPAEESADDDDVPDDVIPFHGRSDASGAATSSAGEGAAAVIPDAEAEAEDESAATAESDDGDSAVDSERAPSEDESKAKRGFLSRLFR